MEVERELRPVRNLVYAIALFTLCASAILVARADEDPFLHVFFDAGIVVVSGVMALLLWDMGSRADERLSRLLAVAIGIAAAFELIHVLSALDFSRDAVDAAKIAGLTRPVTWPPAAFTLLAGLTVAYLLRRRSGIALSAFAIGLVLFGVALLLIFDRFPPYAAPGWFGITRPSLVLLPFLSLFVGIIYWRVRGSERLGSIIALLSILAVVSSVSVAPPPKRPCTGVSIHDSLSET